MVVFHLSRSIAFRANLRSHLDFGMAFSCYYILSGRCKSLIFLNITTLCYTARHIVVT